MILDSLTLTNIRSHKNTTIRFSEGITLFRGDIGSGKSTILMGIEFALFGLDRSTKAEGLLARGADSGEVMLAFHIGDDAYEVGRALKHARKGAEQDGKGAYLRVNEVQEPLSVTQLKSRILEILGLNEPSGANTKSRIYRYAVFTPQDEMKSILYDSKQRLETIRKIFRTEDYQRAVSNSDGLRYEIRESMGRLQGRCENIDRHRADLADSEARLGEIERAIREQEATERDLEEQERSASSSLQEYDGRMRERNALEVQAAGIRSKLDGEQHVCDASRSKIDSNLARINEIRRASASSGELRKPTEKSFGQIGEEIQRFAQLHEEIIRTRSMIASTESQIRPLEEKVRGCGDAETVRRDIDSHESQLGTSQGALDELRRQHDKTNADRIRTEQEVSTLQQGVSDLAKLGAKCAMCGSVLTEEHMLQQESERRGLLQDAQSRLATLSGIHGEQAEQIRSADSAICDIRDRLEVLRNAAVHVAEHERLSEQLDGQRSRLRELDSRNYIPDEPGFQERGAQTPVAYLTGLKEALAGYNVAVERAGDAKREIAHLESANRDEYRSIAESEVRAAGYESELGSISARLDAYAGDDKARFEARRRLDAIQASLRGTRDALAAARTNRGNESERISSLKSDIRDQERYLKKYRKNAAYVGWLGDFFVPVVGRIEKDVLLSLQQSFDKSYRTWYDQLMIDDPTKDSHINEDFAPIVTQDGYDQNIEYLSGGEKTSVALSYRLALNHVARSQTKGLESNLLILDEPTDGLSRNQLAHVREILNGLESKQIILVSHDPELDSHADRVFVVEKSSGVSSVSSEDPSGA